MVPLTLELFSLRLQTLKDLSLLKILKADNGLLQSLSYPLFLLVGLFRVIGMNDPAINQKIRQAFLSS